MQSICKNLGGVISMPCFKGRKLYMYKTKMNSVHLPDDFVDYQDTIHQILGKVENLNDVCYITIDEKEICNDTHRRGGIHVDFNWYESPMSHGEPTGPRHGLKANGMWEIPGQWKPHHYAGGMLLVSNYEGCKVWNGEFEGEIGEGGDCSNIDTSDLKSEIMPSGEVYYLNPIGIHESILIKKNVNRSLVRINFHPEYHFN